jgi:23S rRNA (cytosine1962-C5)-methyltransferase
MRDAGGYELLDCGDGRRLERFASRVVDRPAPAATEPRRLGREAWASADLRFDRPGGWSGGFRSAWSIELDGLILELQATSAGQVGLYPEHHRFWPWLTTDLAERPGAEVLHLFASTGATTLAMARAGARVTHVDGARSAVAWARRNATLSGLAEAPVRWIVDDALGFTRREARRGRRYDTLVLDPPSYGHGPSGSRWDLGTALPELLAAVASVAAEDAVVLVTAHTTGLTADDLADTLTDAFPDGGPVAAEAIELHASSGAVLPAGVAARMIRG